MSCTSTTGAFLCDPPLLLVEAGSNVRQAFVKRLVAFFDMGIYLHFCEIEKSTHVPRTHTANPTHTTVVVVLVGAVVASLESGAVGCRLCCFVF